MRGWVKSSIAVLLAVLLCAAIAPVASATEAPEEGGVLLELTPRKLTRVVVEIHPELGVAVVRTEMGPPYEATKNRPWGMVDYAARIAKAPIEGRLDLEIPGVLSIDGEVAPQQDGEGLEFNGSFRFTGKGGYLNFEARHAAGSSASGATAGCPAGCPSPHPSLFEYINSPITFSGQNTQVLYAEKSLGGRWTRFQATHDEADQGSNFEAHVLEWLPRRVAVLRVIEVAAAPASSYKVSSTAERPKSATVRPPAPFSGSAVYRGAGAGSLRSPSIGRLTGSLSVDLFGVEVRLAGPRAKASLINLNPGY